MILAHYSTAQKILHVEKARFLLVSNARHGNAGPVGHHLRDHLLGNLLQAVSLTVATSLDTGSRFIDQIDGLVGKIAVGQEAHGKLNCGQKGFIGKMNIVMVLVTIAQTAQNLEGILLGGLAHHNLLETTLQSGIGLDITAVFIGGCGAHNGKITTSHGRF